MSYEPTETRYLTHEEQQILHRALLRSWKPVGELVNEVMTKLYAKQERLGKEFEDVLYGNLWDLYEDSSSLKLDTDWIAEYKAYYDTGNQEYGCFGYI